jgi:hypothetical protein
MLLGKSVLGISTLVFIGYGLVEIGAMYGGLQAGVGLFCALALLKPEFYRSGLVLLVLAIGTLALARLVSLLTAPDPVTSYTYGALGYEFVTAMLALVALAKK